METKAARVLPNALSKPFQRQIVGQMHTHSSEIIPYAHKPAMPDLRPTTMTRR